MESLKRYVKSSESIIVFVILELLALMSFGLGGSNTVFFALGILLNILTIPFMIVNSNVRELIHFGIFALPLALMAGLICFGGMYRGQGLGLSNLSSFLAIISFLMLGYNARRIKKFKIETGLLVIGAGLALITFISMVMTWYNYGVGYVTKYVETPIYYYNGFLFDVTKESSWLLGFSMAEVSIMYSGTFGFLSSLYLLGLLFINPKKDWKIFIAYGVIGLIGILALATVPNKFALQLLIPVALLTALYRFVSRMKHTQKVVDIIFFVIVGLVVVCFGIALLNNFNSSVASAIASNSLLNKLFNRKYMYRVNIVIKKIFTEGNFFGVQAKLLNGDVLTTNTQMFEGELLKEGGILALIFFMVFMCFTYLSVRNYSNKSKDSMLAKGMIFALIFGLFFYSSLNYNPFYVIHSESSYYPFFRSLPALLILFLVGYAFNPFFKNDVALYIDSEEFARGVVIEEKKVEKKKIDKDYNFDEEDDLDE